MPTSSSGSPRRRSVLRRALRAFAEDPNPSLPRAAGTHGVDDGRFHAVVGPDWISATRLRLAADELESTVAEIRALGPGPVEWLVGPSATPADLADRLRAVGAGDPPPPLDGHVAALAIDRAPAGRGEGIDVRRIETLEDFQEALEIALAAFPRPTEDERRERAEAEETFARHRSRPGGDWLAYLDGRPAAYAGAVAAEAGLFLVGGATAPWARGRGCYRALVRARWEHAVAHGTPALAVHARHGTSRPILERLGFEHVCDLHVLADRSDR